MKRKCLRESILAQDHGMAMKIRTITKEKLTLVPYAEIISVKGHPPCFGYTNKRYFSYFKITFEIARISLIFVPEEGG